MDVCTYNGKSYSHGSYECQSGRLMKCNNGAWNEVGTSCTKSPADISGIPYVEDYVIQDTPSDDEYATFELETMQRFVPIEKIFQTQTHYVFHGGKTPGDACAEEHLSKHTVPIDDVITPPVFRDRIACKVGNFYYIIKWYKPTKP